MSKKCGAQHADEAAKAVELVRRVVGGSVRRRDLLVVTVLVGCARAGSDPGQAQFAVERYDSTGVSIVHSVINDEAAWPTCALTPQPFVRIGSRDADPDKELYQVEDVRRLSGGRIAVVNRGTDELRVFDDSGELVFSIGREGEGPGEFQDPIEVSVLGPDSLVVWDWDLGRLSVFTGEGTFVRSIRPSPAVLYPTGHFGILSTGPPFVIASHDVQLPTGSSFVPQRLRLYRFDRHGSLIDTIATLPYGTRARIPGPSRSQIGGPLFEGRGAFAVVGDALVTTNGTDPELRVWDVGMTLRRVIRWKPPDRTVSAADVETHKRNALAAASVDLVREMERARLEAVPVSPEYPAVLDVKGDAGGFLWVRRYPRPGSEVTTWLGFDPEGAFHCALTISRRFTILDFSADYAVGKTTDEFDVEYVEVFGLTGNGTP